MLVAYYDKKGKIKESKYELNDAVFAAKVNSSLLTQAVDTFNANQRQSNADVNDRSEVSGGGKKPWKQKGTGRARVGSSRSPLWKGGGKTFGPSNEINYAKKLTKSMRKAAIKAGFTLQAKNGNIAVYEDMELGKEPKTKEVLKLIKDFSDKKLLVIQPEMNDILLNAAHNIQTLNVELVSEVNVIDIMKAQKIIILEKSLEKVNEFWGGKVKAVSEKSDKKVSK